MSEDKNIFGGGNPNSLYTPMTPDEQEVLQRLIDADDLEVHIRQWGIVNKFQHIRFGDARLQLAFLVSFKSPSVHIPVYYFDMELMTRSGRLLFRERCSVGVDPIMVGAGVKLPMVWDIMIQEMDSKVVKEVKPGAKGLTTREGNRKLTTSEQKTLHELRKAEKKVRDQSRREAEEAAKKSLY